MPAVPFQGPERLARISDLQFSQSVGLSAIETRGGGSLPPQLRPALVCVAAMHASP